jgi:GGDEF domain-containing protein
VSQTPSLITAIAGFAILVAAATALTIAPDAPLLAQAARGYPYAGAILALILAARLHRPRSFAAAIALGVTHAVMQPWALGTNPLAHALFVTFLPCGFVLAALFRESAFSLSRALKLLALICTPLALAAFFSARDPARTVLLLTRDLVDPLYTDWSGFSQIALCVLVLALLVGSVRAARTRNAADVCMVYLTLASALALAAPRASIASAIWVLAGGLVLIVTLIETAYAMAYHDELTGMPGRRALAQSLSTLQPPYAVAIVDIDHFKSVNDTYGHDVGDQVLCMVASKLAQVRGGGRAFRTGGEEFTLLFAGLTKHDALPYVDAVREIIAQTPFIVRGHARPRGKRGAEARGQGAATTQQLRVTISAGLGAPTPRLTHTADVIRSADKAMYRAKTEGRNRVIS